MTIIAHTFGWLGFFRRRLGVAPASRPRHATASHPSSERTVPAAISPLPRLAPGREHHRLAIADLCSIAGLQRRVEAAEAVDCAFYRFAVVLYHQRLAHVPRRVLQLARRADESSAGANGLASETSSSAEAMRTSMLPWEHCAATARGDAP